MRGRARHLPGALTAGPICVSHPLRTPFHRATCAGQAGMIRAPSHQPRGLPIPVGELEPSLSLTHLCRLCWI